MLVTTIAGIENVPVGTNLEAISGKILKIYEYKAGENANGQWSLQNVSFQDATGKTTVVLKNRQELGTNWEGAQVYFIAGQNKNRPTGIIVDEYKEKRRIMVNDHATLEEGEAQSPPPRQQSQAPAPRQQGPQQRQSAPQQQRPNLQDEERREQENARPASQQRQQREAPPEKTAEERLHEAKRDILHLSTLFTICHDAAVLHAASVHSRHGHIPHPASIGALATTFFIEANRKGIGRDLPAALPTKVPSPQFKMGDIVAEWERHQAELGLATPAVPADDSPDPKNLSAMPEKEW